MLVVTKIVRRGKKSTRYQVSNGDYLVLDNEVLLSVGQEIPVSGTYQEFDQPLIRFKLPTDHLKESFDYE